MPEPLDVVTAMEKARHIVEQERGGSNDYKLMIVTLAGHMLVAAEIRRLAGAVENVELAIRDSGIV